MKTIYGLPAQNVHTASSNQIYPIGTRLVIGERIFRYCKAGNGLTALKAGQNGYQQYEGNRAAETLSVGDTTVTIPATGSGNSVALTAAACKNGYIWLMSPSQQMHRIKSAVASDSNLVLTLENPITVAAGDSEVWVTAYGNIYYNIKYALNSKTSIMVIPLIDVTSGEYFWGQTWGPCYGTLMATGIGDGASDREVYFNMDGAVMPFADIGTTGFQRAGFLLPDTGTGADQGFMLQISP